MDSQFLHANTQVEVQLCVRFSMRNLLPRAVWLQPYQNLKTIRFEEDFKGSFNALLRTCSQEMARWNHHHRGGSFCVDDQYYRQRRPIKCRLWLLLLLSSWWMLNTVKRKYDCHCPHSAIGHQSMDSLDTHTHCRRSTVDIGRILELRPC